MAVGSNLIVGRLLLTEPARPGRAWGGESLDMLPQDFTLLEIEAINDNQSENRLL